MSTLKETKQEQELNYAKGMLEDAVKKLEDAVKKLEEFKEGENDGKWLEELRGKVRSGGLDKEGKKQLERLEKEKERLEKEKERLEKKIDDWEGQVQYLQKELVKFGRGEREASTSGQKKKLDDFDVTTAKKAFTEKFVHSNNFMDEFRNHIKYCLDTCKKDPSYAPYFALIQSSGYGKSRLIAELAQNIYVVYICLRPENVNGYPLRTSIVRNMINHLQNWEEEEPEIAIDWFQVFLKKTIAVLIEKLQNRELSGPSDFWKMQMSPDTEKNFWDQVIRKMDHDIQFTPNDIPSQHQENSTLHLFLCFDEARQLLYDKDENALSPFRIIRRSIKDIGWVKHGFLCGMLDTMGKLANFSPPTKQDPSHRIRDENIKLLPPFINVMTFDALDYKLKDHTNHCLLFGRPLWGSSVIAGKDIKEVVEFAKCKLLGGYQLSDLTKHIESIFSDEENRIAVSLAILSCLVSLDISTQSQLTHLLVGSYMGTCIGVSKSRENILTMYPSEPILSEVALQIIEIETNRRFILDRLETSLKNGLVEAGHRGELVARLILIFGWQHMLQGTSFYTGERSVVEFLNTIFGDIKIHIKENNKFKHLKLEESFLESKICFTHFIQLTEPPNCLVLKNLFDRSAGAILKRNAYGADLMIPVKINNSSQEKYSYILIQVKNYSISGQAFTDNATKKLSPSNVFKGSELANLGLPYLCFYWSLGATTDNLNKEFMTWKGFEQHLGIFSLKPFSFLSLDLRNKLYAILSAYINPFDSLWKQESTISLEQHKKNVESFFPDLKKMK